MSFLSNIYDNCKPCLLSTKTSGYCANGQSSPVITGRVQHGADTITGSWCTHEYKAVCVKIPLASTRLSMSAQGYLNQKSKLPTLDATDHPE